MGDEVDEAGSPRFEVLEMRSILARSGHASVAEDQLRFEPTALEGFLGAGGWSMPITELRRLERTGADFELVVHGPDGARRLMGREVDALHARLVAAMVAAADAAADAPPQEAAPGSADSATRVLLASSAELSRDGGAWSRGALQVEPDALHFTGSEGTVSLPFSSLEHVGFLGSRQVLELRAEGAVWHLGGPAALFAFGLFVALRGPAEKRGGFEVWDGQRVDGPRARTGRLVCASDRLAFTVTGRLAAMVSGDDTLELRFADVTRVAVRRTGRSSRLEVTCDGVEYGFALPDVEHAFARCSAAMAAVPAPSEPTLVEPGVVLDAEALRSFGDGLARVIFAMPVVVLSEAWTAERGWLWSTERNVRIEAGSTKRAMAWPDVYAPEGVPGPVFLLRIDEGAVSIMPRGGKPASVWLWDRRPLPPRRGSEMPRPSSMAPPSYSIAPPSSRQRNRRESYRAPSFGRGQAVLVRGRGEPDETVSLYDLSMGGCAVLSRAALERGARCTLRLTMDGRSMQLACLAAHSAPQAVGQVPWRVGLRFQGLTPQQSSDLGDVWMSLQRLELRTPRGGS